MAEKDFTAVFASDNRANLPVYPADVFTLTDAGTAQLQAGATTLPAQALALMVLLDGKASVGDLEGKLPQIPSEALRDVLRSLVSGGLARAATLAETGGLDLDFTAFFGAAAQGTEPTAGAQASAERDAQSGTPQLSREGYYVSIARRAVKTRAPGAGARLGAFVVEDDADVANLVTRLMQNAGFEVTAAASRDGILERLRKPPLPDVVILDVMLPDVNGFDVLQRLKAHAALKAIPVIMLTAEAKRESVMRGLLGGADGYITKPFDHAHLVAGVRAVLGLGS